MRGLIEHLQRPEKEQTSIPYPFAYNFLKIHIPEVIVSRQALK